MLDRDMVIRLTGERFGEFASVQGVLASSTICSMRWRCRSARASPIAGLVSYSGKPELDRSQMTVLQLLSYSLFSQLRLIDRESKGRR